MPTTSFLAEEKYDDSLNEMAHVSPVVLLETTMSP